MKDSTAQRAIEVWNPHRGRGRGRADMALSQNGAPTAGSKPQQLSGFFAWGTPWTKPNSWDSKSQGMDEPKPTAAPDPYLNAGPDPYLRITAERSIPAFEPQPFCELS